MSDFWAFVVSRSGGYGDYIWPAYGVSVLGLGIATAWTLIAWRNAKRRLKELEKADLEQKK
jgi:heme exporter protein CcmD